MIKRHDWGVVEALKVHAGTDTSLKAAFTIALTEHRSLSHYGVQAGKNGLLSLVFFWSKPSSNEAHHQFITPLTDADDLMRETRRWLGAAAYPKDEPDTDGSVKKGYIFVVGADCGWSYRACKVTPAWVVYGK